MKQTCNNHVFVFVKFNTDGGRVQLRKQCFSCGEVDGHIYKFSECANINDLPLLNVELREQFYLRESQIRTAEYEAYKEQKQKEFDAERERRRIEYANYLQSYEWKRKHNYIMQKEGHPFDLQMQQAQKIGEELRLLIYTFTNIDMHEIARK